MTRGRNLRAERRGDALHRAAEHPDLRDQAVPVDRGDEVAGWRHAVLVPAGKTAPVRQWLRAGALVQAKLTGRVRVLVTIMRDGSAVGTRVLTLKLKRR